MNIFLLTILLAGLVYFCRLSGFIFGKDKLSPLWQTYLRFVPIAVFSAFIVPSTLRETDILGTKLIAFAVAGFIMWKTQQFAVSVAVGLGVLWLLTLI